METTDGAAEQILDYMQKNRNATEEYNIQASKEQAGKDAQIRLNNFIENLELAQSYGQIEETKENKKEKIQKIANEWFAYADETEKLWLLQTNPGGVREKTSRGRKGARRGTSSRGGRNRE